MNASKSTKSRLFRLYGVSVLGILLPSLFLKAMSVRSLYQARTLAAQDAERRLRGSLEALRDEMNRWVEIRLQEARKTGHVYFQAPAGWPAAVTIRVNGRKLLAQFNLP